MPTRHKAFNLRHGLALHLRLRRRACGLTQEVLAFESGVHRNYVSLLERGIKSPTIDVLERLASALGATPSTLLKRAEALTKRRQANA